MTDRKAALEALDRIDDGACTVEDKDDIATIRAALSEPAAEPAAWITPENLECLQLHMDVPPTVLFSSERRLVEATIPLYAAPPAVVPQGWKTVPTGEPTKEMLDAAWAQIDAGNDPTPRDIWFLMLAAAPKPEEKP